MDTAFNTLVINRPRPGNQGTMLSGEPVNSAKRLNTKQSLVLELCERADTLGLTSLELLARRIAALHQRILRALGEISFEQFQTAEPAGYLHLLLSGSDLRVRVAFSRHRQSEAIYLESLMTPGELQQHKMRLLLRIREQTPAGARLMHAEAPERLLSDWLVVADWLKHAEEHWNGRKKEELAYEIIAPVRVQLKILSSTGMDLDPTSRPFVIKSSRLEPRARKILSSEDPDSCSQVKRTREFPTEAL